MCTLAGINENVMFTHSSFLHIFYMSKMGLSLEGKEYNDKKASIKLVNAVKVEP